MFSWIHTLPANKSCSYLCIIQHALLKLTGNYITFSMQRTGLQDVKVGFYQVAGFPNVMGAIDSTHIALSPRSMEPTLQGDNADKEEN